MRELNVDQVTAAVAQLSIEACRYLGEDVSPVGAGPSRRKSAFGCFILNRSKEPGGSSQNNSPSAKIRG